MKPREDDKPPSLASFSRIEEKNAKDNNELKVLLSSCTTKEKQPRTMTNWDFSLSSFFPIEETNIKRQRRARRLVIVFLQLKKNNQG